MWGQWVVQYCKQYMSPYEFIVHKENVLYQYQYVIMSKAYQMYWFDCPFFVIVVEFSHKNASRLLPINFIKIKLNEQNVTVVAYLPSFSVQLNRLDVQLREICQSICTHILNKFKWLNWHCHKICFWNVLIINMGIFGSESV